MHYNKRYKTHEREAYREACADALYYMGPAAYKIVARQIMGGQASEDQIRFLASFGGVSGFPVTAMIDRYSRD